MLNNTEEHDDHEDENQNDDEETDEATTPLSGEERAAHGAHRPERGAMSMFVRAERPSPRIVLTSPEGAVQSLRGDGYLG